MANDPWTNIWKNGVPDAKKLNTEIRILGMLNEGATAQTIMEQIGVTRDELVALCKEYLAIYVPPSIQRMDGCDSSVSYETMRAIVAGRI